jgi:phosphoribosyl-ATP pyrophosphohydrolase
MKSLSMLLMLCAVPLMISAREPAADKAKEESQKAAEAWLALTDGGKAGDSWEAAAIIFKAVVTKEQWEKALEAARKPLGELVSRELKRASPTDTLPGAPDGEYVVLEFTSSFARKKEAVETVTPMKDKDGTWRVSGYFIK